MNNTTISRIITAAALLSGVVTSFAGTSGPAASGGKNPPALVTEAKEESVFDKIWGLATIYKDESNPIIERFSLTGRYHGQYYATDSDTGNESDWENRRFRIGAEAELFNKHLKLKGEIFSDLNEPYGEFYDGFTELYASFVASDAFALTVGKQKPKFGWDWSTSSRLIQTFERSRMTNQFKPDYSLGVSASGKSGAWSYFAGVFANDPNKEFAEMDGGASYIASLGYNFKEQWGMDNANLTVGYIHSTHDAGDVVFTNFDNGVSASLELKKGQVGMNTEVLFGEGDAGNTWGLTLQPYYDITKKLQLVARYQLGLSDEANGLAPQKRYEKISGGSNGDTYNAGYLGLNYFIYEHKAKLMAGVEYANLDGGSGAGYDGFTFMTGVRVYW